MKYDKVIELKVQIDITKQTIEHYEKELRKARKIQEQQMNELMEIVSIVKSKEEE